MAGTLVIDLSGLNEPQRTAVQTVEGPLLVLAGAGTGKTRVITTRMAYLIDRGVKPDSILSVTFTNKAAKEMGERTHALLGKRAKEKPWISTFHSLCVRVLREHIELLGYPRRFTICDRGDQEGAAREALREIRIGDGQIKPGDLVNEISTWKSAGVSADRASAVAETDRDLVAAMGYRRYQSKLQAAGAVDFDDLLLLTDKLLREHDDVREQLQRRFRFVQIDEYQDTNGIQFRLVQRLVEKSRNVCVVGDDDQSIYAWRGADVSHILSFPRHYPDATVVRLEDNYRCTGRILSAANTLVARNTGRHKKTLRAAKPDGQPVDVREYTDEAAEAMEVVREIRYWNDVGGVPLRDFAILFRTNEQPRVFEQELRQAKLPYVLLGSQSFFDRREVKDVLSYLKAIMNPRDDMSLLRIINRPARGLGEKSVRAVLDRAVKDGRVFWDAVDAVASDRQISPGARSAFRDFHHLLQRLRAESESGSLEQFVRSLVARIGYEDQLAKDYTEPTQLQARLGAMEQLYEAVADYERDNPRPSLDGFLESTTLDAPEKASDKEEAAKQNAVKLMTLHSAKGLEFPRVFLVGLEEGILPHKRSVEMGGAAIEEERRLAYVGITRAQDTLVISRAAARKKWGKMRPGKPSRFLRELVAAAE